MKALIFNGALERRPLSTSHKIVTFLTEELKTAGVEPIVFHLAEAGIPFLDTTIRDRPRSVKLMAELFRQADVQIWITPLYHGGMTGAMKNCLDWLEITAKDPIPYLTGKLIGLVCWADGGKAMLGIQAMDMVAKSLRAFVHPYTVPIVRKDLYKIEYTSLSEEYTARLCKLSQLLIKSASKNDQIL